MIRLIRRLAAGLWCTVTWAASSSADIAALKQLSLEELSRIEVTSPSKAPQQASRVPMAIYVITSEDIRRSGVTSIPEALRLAPGVEVARIEGSKWSVGIRGFGSRLSRSVLVLIDGRTVYTTFFAGTYWEVQDTVLDDIERIEVIRGPGGTIWGPNAVNGVVNIITKHARDTQGVLVSAVAGDKDAGILQLRYGGGKGDGLHYRFYGKAFTKGPQFHTDGRNFDDWRSIQGGFRVDWNRSDRDEVTLTGDLYQQAAGQRVKVISYTQPFAHIVEDNADLSGGNLNLRWTRKRGEDGAVQVQTFYDRTSRFESNFGERRQTVDLDFNVRHNMVKRQRVSWGAGIRASRGVAEEVTSGLTFSPLARTDYLATAFLQDEISIVPDRLSLTLGTKLLRTNFADGQAEPSVRLMWTPAKRISAWASFTRAVRTPSRAENDFYLSGYIGTTASGAPYFARFNANPLFTSERLKGWELGFRYLPTPKLYVDIASFRNRYDDLFSQDLGGSPFFEQSPGVPHQLLPVQFRNSLYGYTTGYEVAPEWRGREWWRLRGSYSFLSMDLRKYPNTQELGTAPITEGSSPRHQIVVQSSADWRKRFEFDLTYRYVSALKGQGIPDYSTGDARLGWRIRRDLDLSFVGRNLLQPWHPEFGNDPGPVVGIRRVAYVRLTWAK